MGLIKKIFGGLFAFLANLFGFGKKSEFYMELDESSVSAPSAPIESAVTANPQPVVAPSREQQVPQTVKAEKTPSSAQEKVSAQETAVSPSLEPARPLVLPRPQAELSAEQTPQLTNFATDFLVNPKLNRSPRRRPGPSVSPFKDMVKDMGRRSPSMG